MKKMKKSWNVRKTAACRRISVLLTVVLLLSLLSSFFAFAETQGSGADAAQVNKVSTITVSSKKLAVDVGLYIKGAPGGKLSASTIKKQLKAVKKFANTVRFYGAAGQLTKAYKIARKMKFKIIGTAWLSGNDKADRKELNALAKVCRKGYVDVACVGSETLYRGNLSPSKLVSYINEFRSTIGGKVPVTTADDSSRLLWYPEVVNACDLIMVNAYPYWGGVSVTDAAGAFDQTISRVRRKYPGKELIVSETGWPTAGGSKGSAVAGEAQARQYFDDIRRWSQENNIVVLWFDAADEPWKAGSGDGAVGSHWGIMTRKCKVKSCYKGAF